MNLVQRWWDWCSESLSHTFAGVTAPILLIAAFFVVVFYAMHGGDASGPMPPRSDVAGVCVTGTPGAGCGTTTPLTGMSVSTATPVPPTPTPQPRSYTVQAGDTLSRICGNEVPDMSLDDCVGRIVDLSDLGGPHEIFEGQTLTLPPSSGATASTNRTAARATPTVVDPEPTAEVASEPEPEPEPTQASLVAIGPAIEPAGDDEAADEPEPVETPSEEEVATPSEEEIEASAGTEYTIQAGDSLLGICVNEVPEMDEDECIEFVVLLNDLESPEQIIEGQTIFLP